jgi:hypothetical protein
MNYQLTSLSPARQVPRSAYIRPVAVFEFIFSMCSVEGSIGEPHFVNLRLEAD